MATFAELYQIIGLEVEDAPTLRRKVAVAVLVAANAIARGDDDEAPFSQEDGAHELRVRWAASALACQDDIISRVFRSAVCANTAASKAQILAASDAAIQSSVNAIIDTLAAGLT